VVRSPDPEALGGALRTAGIGYVTGPEQTFTVDVLGGRVSLEAVARVAFAERVLLTELRASDSNGLEQLFFSLTATHAEHPKETRA
jgi:ABC-2 type transport system ATP-binding protein